MKKIVILALYIGLASTQYVSAAAEAEVASLQFNQRDAKGNTAFDRAIRAGFKRYEVPPCINEDGMCEQTFTWRLVLEFPLEKMKNLVLTGEDIEQKLRGRDGKSVLETLQAFSQKAVYASACREAIETINKAVEDRRVFIDGALREYLPMSLAKLVLENLYKSEDVC